MTGALDGDGQLALMGSAGAGGTAGQNLAALGQVTAQLGRVLVVDRESTLSTQKLADLPALARTHPIVSHGESSFFSNLCGKFAMELRTEARQSSASEHGEVRRGRAGRSRLRGGASAAGL